MSRRATLWRWMGSILLAMLIALPVTSARSHAGQPPAAGPTKFTAIPYCVWDNRAPGEMVVWLPQDPCAAEPTR